MTKALTRLQLGVGFIAALAMGFGVAATSVPTPARVIVIGSAALAALVAWRYGADGHRQTALEENWNRAALRSQLMRELSRARRAGAHVVLAVVSLEGDGEAMATDVEAANNLVRLHDLVGYDRHHHEVNLVAVVPHGDAASAFVAKVAEQFGSARVRSTSSAAEATSAAELMTRLDGTGDTLVASSLSRQSA